MPIRCMVQKISWNGWSVSLGSSVECLDGCGVGVGLKAEGLGSSVECLDGCGVGVGLRAEGLNG